MEEGTRQLTLPEVIEELEEGAPTRVLRTEHFFVKTREESLERFIDGLDKVKRNGNPKYTETEKHTKRLLWVQDKMKPCIK